MKKIMILGSAGAGKSTLARRIGTIIGIEVYHLDRFFWQKNWIPITQEELYKKVKSIVAKDSWIIDGNYSKSMDIRFNNADMIIFLDMPLWLCLWRVIIRRFKYSNKQRSDMGEECKEKIDWEFVKWIINYHKNKKQKLYKKLNQLSDEKRVYIIKNKKDKEELINTLCSDK